MNLVFLGAPGSGKGTQAGRLALRLAASHLATGDLLRAAVNAGSNLGRQAEAFMNAGELVPDEVIIGLIVEKQRMGELNGGFILDGFPRTLPQATALEKMCAEVGAGIDRAVLLEVEDDEIVRRLSGRLYCTRCHAGYNVHHDDSRPQAEGVCDRCHGPLTRRGDDDAGVIRNRVQVFRSQIRPIAEYYRSQSVLLTIAGNGTPDEVFSRIAEELGLE